MKRVFDIAACCAALPVTVPLLLILGFLVWLDSPGPVFFTQFRTGRGGCRFRMYKLRTMVSNAEDLKRQLAHLNELIWPDFKIANDPRMTKIGAFLRKTSLDELPQLFNVLKGDMSLVGPRPTSFSHTTYSLCQTERLEVRPGITGLWQVRGRSDLGFEERVQLDVEYIENRSLWLDLMILAETVTAVLRRRGAY